MNTSNGFIKTQLHTVNCFSITNITDRDPFFFQFKIKLIEMFKTNSTLIAQDSRGCSNALVTLAEVDLVIVQ